MLIYKQLTKYGYNAQIRYDTVSPRIYVIETGCTLVLDGESDISVITGEILSERMVEKRLIKDKLVTGSTYRIPLNDTTIMTAIEKAVILVHNDENLNNKYITDFKCLEDDASSDDLKYIENEEEDDIAEEDKYYDY